MDDHRTKNKKERLSAMNRKLFMFVSCAALVMLLSSCGGDSSGSSGTPKVEPTEKQASISTPQPTPESAKEPAVEKVYEDFHTFEDSLGSQNAVYMCELKNTGSVPVKVSDISIEVSDATGKILKLSDYISCYPDVIAPGESAYIYEQVINGMIDTDIDVNSATTAVLKYDLDKKDTMQSNLEITQINYSVKSNYPNMTGKVKNNGSEDATLVYVTAPVFDENGKLQTVMFTIIDELKAGEESAFDQMGIMSESGLNYENSTLGTCVVYERTFF